MGQLQDMQNKATETITDAVRYVAPESVDRILDKVDQTNRENAQALKNARSVVTNSDTADDLMAAKAGIKRPLAEDLHRKLMYFPEAIPNAIDSAIKGDFKDDDGSYSDRVGKIIGGLNPAGDVRDIIANGKGVIEGKPGAWIGLGGATLGVIPIIGDGGKIIFKAEREAITEGAEKLVKQGIEKEVAEKIAKEDVTKLVEEAGEKLVEKRQQFKQIFGETRYNEYAEKIEQAKMSRPELRGITPSHYKDLTNHELETQKEVDEFLKTEIWQPLYGDEPIKV